MNFLIEGQEAVFADLEQVIRQGNALAFVGSGVSRDAGYPSWYELVEQFAVTAGISLSSDDQDADGARFIEILQECRDQLEEAAYYAELRRIFNPDVRDPFSIMHVQILEMPFVSFPTTNIDNCHVLAKGNVRQHDIASDWDVIPHLQIDRLRERRIFFLHGKLESDDRIRSVVLSKSEYHNAYKSDGPAREFLLYVLRRFDCVFIGYSMSDPFMARVIEEAGTVQRSEIEELRRQGRPLPREPRHFAVLPRHLAADGKLYIPKGKGRPLKKEELERLELQRIATEELLKRLRITPIYYRVVNDNFSTLKQLVYYLNRRLVTETEQVPA